MAQVTSEIKQRVTDKLNACIAIANNHYGIDVSMPTVVYKKRGTTAGTACHTTNTIDLNPALMMSNLEAFMKRTVPHELAHLITSKLYPETTNPGWGRKRSIHGSEWKSVMRVLGCDPSRCHSYDTSAVKKRTTSYEYICESCGNSVMLGIKRHNKQQNALIRGRNQYSHSGCNRAKLIWKPQFTSVLAAEKPIEPTVKRTAPSTGKTSKKAQAIATYKSMSGSSRGDIIAKFMEAGLTKAGASTYYSNIKSGKWV